MCANCRPAAMALVCTFAYCKATASLQARPGRKVGVCS